MLLKRQISMGLNPAVPSPLSHGPGEDGGTGREPVASPVTVAEQAAAVAALYQASALGMVRLAYVMIGDLSAAEDIVQDAFCGLYRRWTHLHNPDKALSYVRSSVLNACRSALRRKRPELCGEAPVRPGSIAGAMVRRGSSDHRGAAPDRHGGAAYAAGPAA